MAIDPQKVLVVFNSNSTLGSASLANAEYYATARGLRTSGNYHRMGFDFGSSTTAILALAGVPGAPGGNVLISALTPNYVTTASGATTAYAGMALMSAVAQFISDNAIEALLVECNVPPNVFTGVDKISYVVYMPIEGLLGMAPGRPTGLVVYSGVASVARGLMPGLTRKPSTGAGTLDGNLLTGVLVQSPTMNRFKALQRATMVPNGRIGYPGASSAEVQRCVNDAVWAETQNNLGKLHVIGGSPYTASNVPYDNVSSHALFAQSGFTSMAHFDSDTAFAEYTGATVSRHAYGTGAISLQSLGLLYGAGSQNSTDYALGGPIYANHQPMRGGWSFAWQSSAFMQGVCTLVKGGCASVCNAQSEPLATGLPGQLEFAASLVAGLTFAEAVFLSSEMLGTRSTAYGDPLYRPYALTALVANEYSRGS